MKGLRKAPCPVLGDRKGVFFLSSTLVSIPLLLVRCRGVAHRPLQHSRTAGRPVPQAEVAMIK